MNAIGKTMMAVSTALLMAGTIACNRQKENDLQKAINYALKEMEKPDYPAKYTICEVDYLKENPGSEVGFPQYIDVAKLDEISTEAKEKTSKAYSDFERNAFNNTRDDSIVMYNVIKDSEKTMQAVDFLKAQRAQYDAEQKCRDSIFEAQMKEQEQAMSAEMKATIGEYANNTRLNELIQHINNANPYKE